MPYMNMDDLTYKEIKENVIEIFDETIAVSGNSVQGAFGRIDYEYWLDKFDDFQVTPRIDKLRAQIAIIYLGQEKQFFAETMFENLAKLISSCSQAEYDELQTQDYTNMISDLNKLVLSGERKLTVEAAILGITSASKGRS